MLRTKEKINIFAAIPRRSTDHVRYAMDSSMIRDRMVERKMEELFFTAGPQGTRVDRFLSEVMPEVSRSYIQKLIKGHFITVGGKEIKSNYKLNEGDEVKVLIPRPVSADIEPEDIPLDILYEDNDILIVNKPKNMVVHPAPGHYSGTLVNAVMYHCRDNLSGIGGVSRPGIVHRIDKDTTGSLIICKNDRAHKALAEQLKEHHITRKYHAIVHGTIHEDSGFLQTSIGRHPTDRKRMSTKAPNGRSALTHYRVLERFERFTYIECQLETGRTHQIRVHMASIGHPILGDTVYGPARCPFQLEGQTLHAKTLGITHPTTGEYMEFDAPLPEYFVKLLDILRVKRGA